MAPLLLFYILNHDSRVLLSFSTLLSSPTVTLFFYHLKHDSVLSFLSRLLLSPSPPSPFLSHPSHPSLSLSQAAMGDESDVKAHSGSSETAWLRAPRPLHAPRNVVLRHSLPSLGPLSAALAHDVQGGGQVCSSSSSSSVFYSLSPSPSLSLPPGPSSAVRGLGPGSGPAAPRTAGLGGRPAGSPGRPRASVDSSGNPPSFLSFSSPLFSSSLLRVLERRRRRGLWC